MLGYAPVGNRGLVLLATRVKTVVTLPGSHEVRLVTNSKWASIPLEVGTSQTWANFAALLKHGRPDQHAPLACSAITNATLGASAGGLPSADDVRHSIAPELGCFSLQGKDVQGLPLSRAEQERLLLLAEYTLDNAHFYCEVDSRSILPVLPQTKCHHCS